MKYFFTLMIAFSMFKANAARVTPTQFIEIAAKQSMLSQKIAKNYMLLAYSAQENESSLLDLKISTSYFKRNLETLKTYASGNEKLSSAIKVQSTAWGYFNDILKKEKTAENAVEALKLSEALLKASNYVLAIGSKDYRKLNSDIKLATLINVTNKQSALSERLALLFINQKLQAQLDKKLKMGSESLEQTFLQMDQSIGMMIASPVNTKAHTELLVGKTSIEFDRLKENKDDFFKAKLEVKEVLTIANALTKFYNELAYSYINMK